MFDDLLALLDKPLLLLIVMAIGGVIGIALENALNRIDREKRRAYWRGRNGAKGLAGKAVDGARSLRRRSAQGGDESPLHPVGLELQAKNQGNPPPQ